MTTAESLKKQYKTFAAAKADKGIKAKSWVALAEKINAAGLQARITELEAENAALKQQLAGGNAENEYKSEYFKSAEAEMIYSIVKLDGEERMRALNITRNHYSNAKKAKEWRNELANQVHPDKCSHPAAQTAAAKVVEIYRLMVA